MKLVIFIITFLFFASVNLFAQSFANSSATVNLKLIRGLTINTSGTNTLNFGEIIINNSAQDISIPNSDGQQFYITGHPNRSITVNYNSEVVMDLINDEDNFGNGNSNLTFITNIAEQTGSNPTYSEPELIQSGSSVALQNQESIGVLYLWLGGDIHIPENISSGEYVGQLNIDITY